MATSLLQRATTGAGNAPFGIDVYKLSSDDKITFTHTPFELFISGKSSIVGVSPISLNSVKYPMGISPNSSESDVRIAHLYSSYSGNTISLYMTCSTSSMYLYCPNTHTVSNYASCSIYVLALYNK